MMTKTRTLHIPVTLRTTRLPQPTPKHDYEPNHHDMTSIRQYEPTSNERIPRTERRNENDNPCKLVEEDRTILEPTAQPPALPHKKTGIRYTPFVIRFSALVRQTEEKKALLFFVTPSRALHSVFRLSFLCSATATTNAVFTLLHITFSLIASLALGFGSWGRKKI